MAMRETVGSLRAYLILSGLLATFAYGVPLLFGASGIAAIVCLAGVVVALAYIFLGIRLKSLLIKSPVTITRILMGGIAFLIVALAIQVVFGRAAAALPGALAGLLITWYIYVNARRLSAESRAQPTVVT